MHKPHPMTHVIDMGRNICHLGSSLLTPGNVNEEVLASVNAHEARWATEKQLRRNAVASPCHAAGAPGLTV